MEIEYTPNPEKFLGNLSRYLVLLRQLSLDETITFDGKGKVIVHDPKQRSKEDYSLTNPFLPQFLEDYNYGGRVN
jgi:hypothetical protein